MNSKEKAEYTYKMLQERKRNKLEGLKQAENFSIENMYKVKKRMRRAKR